MFLDLLLLLLFISLYDSFCVCQMLLHILYFNMAQKQTIIFYSFLNFMKVCHVYSSIIIAVTTTGNKTIMMSVIDPMITHSMLNSLSACSMKLISVYARSPPNQGISHQGVYQLILLADHLRIQKPVYSPHPFSVFLNLSV